MNNKILIRESKKEDIPQILEFIKALADYEKLPKEVTATEKILEESLFDNKKFAECLIAEFENKPAGFAIFFHNFSTFLGKPGLYLEDLFVYPEFRGKGIGKALFTKVAKIAVERNCGRMEWSVLDWNKPSIDFYLSYGAKAMDEWTVYRLTGKSLTKTALLSNN